MKGFLLDTHILLWWLAEPQRLPSKAHEVIADPGNPLFVSAASLWEASIKAALGRLDLPETLLEGMESQGMEELPVTASHALAVQRLPMLHRDPFDRMLIAQALAEELTLISADSIMSRYDVDLLHD
ncbi:type II toxin-antitoxin system VapC family toxin [Fodinicurvata fenggangensis]|uniref:type II toxin-antitoxin system VapC family toxin n=1 Tax=Fodinicurvata fenggangensis TaxID=1121830 RepID=UPI00047AF08F|nr:type II toxin-antitoxin system VapC family toxin [Fodinicurvata fenggangensis]